MVKTLKTVVSIVPAGILILWIYWGSVGMVGSLSDFFFTNELPPPKVEETSFMVGGIQMNEGDQENWVNTVKRTGMNTVEVTVYAQQGRWDENNLWYYEYQDGVMEEIKLAKAAGLKVVLILRLQLDHAFEDNKFKWHGMVFPKTDYLLQRWFEEYTRFASKWARVCEEEDVDVLVIGSEMNSMFATRRVDKLPQLEEYFLNADKQARFGKRMMQFEDSLTENHLVSELGDKYEDLGNYLNDEVESKRQWAQQVAIPDTGDTILAINVRRTVLNYYWVRMIDQLRQIYKGKMTVAANFDNYHQVSFWHKLDFIGINAYFPLRNLKDHPDASSNLEGVLRTKWDQTLDEITEFSKLAGVPDHPILFTELGYTNYSGSTIQPWQGFGFSLLETAEKTESGNADSLIIWKKQKIDASERNLAVRTLYDAVLAKRFPLAGILYWKLTTKLDQLKYDPFAMHLAPEPTDSLQLFLLRFKGMEAEMKRALEKDRALELEQGKEAN